jgi:hypothetical protein
MPGLNLEKVLGILPNFWVEVEGDTLYGLDRQGTVGVRLKLDGRYERFSIDTKNYEPGSRLLRVRGDDKFAWFQKGETLLRVEFPDLDFSVRDVISGLRTDGQKLINLSPQILKKIVETSNYCFYARILNNQGTIFIEAVDTSKGIVIVHKIKSLFPQKEFEPFLVPTRKFDLVEKLGFENSEMYDCGDYYALRKGEDTIFLAKLKVRQ